MEKNNSKSWFQIIPGIVTGVASIITASSAIMQVSSPPSTSNELRAVIDDPDRYTNIRSGQGTHHTIVSRIMEGEVFYTIQGQGDWWPVRTTKGTHGYVHRSRIKIQNRVV